MMHLAKLQAPELF